MTNPRAGRTQIKPVAGAVAASAIVSTLPAEQRAVLLLVALEDMAYADAARVLQIPVGTVMSRLSRARARLRELMEPMQAPAQPPALRRLK